MGATQLYLPIAVTTVILVAAMTVSGWSVTAHSLTNMHVEHILCMCEHSLRSCCCAALQYLKYLEKGQVAPTALSMTTFTVDLTLEADKYRLTVQRAGPDMLRLQLNQTTVDVGARKLSDGSILVQVDGCAHVVHTEKEVTGTRLIIDNLTCLLPNEHDPSSLRAASPGKLLRCARSAWRRCGGRRLFAAAGTCIHCIVSSHVHALLLHL